MCIRVSSVMRSMRSSRSRIISMRVRIRRCGSSRVRRRMYGVTRGRHIRSRNVC